MDPTRRPQLRQRSRKFPYQASLPYKTESETEQLAHLNHILNNLYIAIKGDDLKGLIGNSTGSSVVHWTRELRGWMELKFDMPLEIRLKLIRLYFNLSITGSDGNAIDKFVNMFISLCKDDIVQEIPAREFDLDWKSLVFIMRKLAFPQQSSYNGNITKSFNALLRLAQVARPLVDSSVLMDTLKEILPFVSSY
jgi:proteasome activator subunit 4